jgi:hypothetical protein
MKPEIDIIPAFHPRNGRNRSAQEDREESQAAEPQHEKTKLWLLAKFLERREASQLRLLKFAIFFDDLGVGQVSSGLEGCVR